jgi:hypothetical protein
MLLLRSNLRLTIYEVIACIISLVSCLCEWSLQGSVVFRTPGILKVDDVIALAIEQTSVARHLRHVVSLGLS